MANPFDQFDPAPSAANPFDQFDAAQIPGAAPGQVAPPSTREPETTTAGVVGGITRGAALPLAGAAAGMAMGGPPGAAAGGAAGVLAPLAADPLVNLFNQTFGTQVQRPSEALQMLLTRLGVAQPQSGAERFAQEATAGVAAGTAIPAAAGRMAAAMAQGTRAAPVVAPIAEAVRVSGMGPTGGATMGQRMGAGAVAGGLGAGPVSEDAIDVAVGMAGGGLFPPLAKAGGDVVSGLWNSIIRPTLQPETAAVSQLYRAAGGTPGAAERVISEVEAGRQVPTTPGFRPTLPELVIAGGGEAPPTLAVLTERVRGASPEQVREIGRLANERVGALQAQLARVNQQIEQQGMMLQPGALEELTQARDAIIRNLDTERAQREAVLQASAARLPSDPQATGEALATRIRDLSNEFRQTQVRPAYQAAENAAGDAPINIDDVIAQAERVLERPLSSFAPETAPAVVRRILALRPAQEAADAGPELLDQFGQPIPRPAAPAEPTTATLRQLDDLRKAINSDALAASRGQGSLAGIETRNLLELQRSIDAAIETSTTLPQQAKDLYADALRTYREGYAPRFREGEAGRVLTPSTFGEQRIEPAQVVAQFTKDRDAAQQFVRTFAGDPDAYDALRNGILGQFRLAAVDARTGLVDSAKAAGYLQKNAEALAVLDNAGMGLRGAMQQFEQEAAQGSAALEALRTSVSRWADKTPTQMLDHILSSGDRMGIALSRTDAAGRDAIRRVVQTRLNQMLTQTPGGKPLTEADAMRVVKEITDDTGNLKPAYEKVLGRDLATQFADRAKGLRLVIETGKDKALQNPNAVAPVIRGQNFTPQQLTNIQLVLDDVSRIRQTEQAAQSARAAVEPTGGKVLEEQAETSAFRPDRLQLLDRYYTLLRNVFVGARDRLNPKVSAKLANMLYNNPDEAIAALRSEIARVQRKAQPAGVSRAAPAAYGATYGGISTQVIDTPELREQTQE